MQSLPGNIHAVQQSNAYAMQESTSLRSVAETSFRHRGLWLSIVITVFAMAVLYTLLIPRQYKSDMEILVQNKRGDEQITPNRLTGTVTVNEVTEEQMNSEIELLLSRSLANVVVDPEWNNRNLSAMSPQQLEGHEKAVDKYYKHLSVQLVRRSNVIHATYTASDPKVASDTLSRLLSAFLAKQREIAQPPGTAQFFADQAAHYKRDLDQAQQELAQYQQQNQIVSLNDTEQAIDREIDEAETDLRSTDAQIAELSRRIGSQTAQLNGIPNRQVTQERTLPNDYSVERLNTMLAELQNRRTELMTKFTPEDRLVQEVDHQIADTKKALTDAQHLKSQERATDVNPVWQSVTGTIVQDQTARQALKAKHDALTQQIAELRKNLGNTESSTVPYSTLRQRVVDLENNYQLYAQKRDEAQIADAMNQSRLLNVAVTQNPTFNIMPSRPKPLVDIALGGFTALFLACFMVFFAEMGRGTIATSAEVERVTQFPVLATVPMNRVAGKKREHLRESAPVFIGMASTPARQRTINAPLVRYRKESRA
jgi:uncharacterized protein involved in exopolysaccharide biosynthesis